MDKDITGETGITIGMDVSDRFTETFALDECEWKTGGGFELVARTQRDRQGGRRVRNEAW